MQFFTSPNQFLLDWDLGQVVFGADWTLFWYGAAVVVIAW